MNIDTLFTSPKAKKCCIRFLYGPVFLILRRNNLSYEFSYHYISFVYKILGQWVSGLNVVETPGGAVKTELLGLTTGVWFSRTGRGLSMYIFDKLLSDIDAFTQRPHWNHYTESLNHKLKKIYKKK